MIYVLINLEKIASFKDNFLRRNFTRKFAKFYILIIGFFKNTMKFGNKTFRVVNRYYLKEIFKAPTNIDGDSENIVCN